MKIEESSLLTRGQLERSIAQSVLALYRKKFGHCPTNITCHLLERKLVITMENSITQPEQVLIDKDDLKLVQQVRDALDAAIEPSLKHLIEEISGIQVLDLLSDTTVETGRLGMIAILAQEPKFLPVTAGLKKSH